MSEVPSLFSLSLPALWSHVPPAAVCWKPAVVLLHGVLGSHRSMQRIAEGLSSAGFDVVMLDLLGFGRSPWHANAFDTDAHVRALRKALVHLDGYIVVGHSFGALLGRQLLLRDEICLGCVSVATPAFGSMADLDVVAWQTAKPFWALYRSPKWLTHLVCACICQQRWFWKPLAAFILAPLVAAVKGWRNATTLVEDFFDHSHESCYASIHRCLIPLMLAPIDIEILSDRAVFVHGTADVYTTCKELCAKIGDVERARLHLVEGADHFTILERPDAIDAIVCVCARLSAAVIKQRGCG